MRSAPTLPLLAAILSAFLWGLWWIPIRGLHDMGMSGPWAGVAMVAGALPALILFQLLAKNRVRPNRYGIAGAILVGFAVTLYSTSLASTTIIRAVLLFYLAPAWTLAIDCIWFGRRFRALNALAIALALVGIACVFRGDFGDDAWRWGDVMALTSGACWAGGAALIFANPRSSIATLSLLSCSVAVLVGVVAAVIAQPLPPPHVFTDTAVNAIAGGLIYVAPIMLATLWGARRLGATTVTFLLSGEILVGVASVAILENEPFGWPEVIGTALIITATLIEVFQPRPPAAPG